MKLTDAPEEGIMYALYIDRVVYERYKRQELPPEEQLKDRLLELHLFNETAEYRYVKTRKGEIQTRIDDETEHEDIYTERIYTQDGKTVEVVNYITYDDNDLMRIDNYRLKEVK